MMKNWKIWMFLLVTPAAVFLAGCSTTGSMGTAGSGSADSSEVEKSSSSTEKVSAEYPAYLEIASGKIYQTAEKPVANGGYVGGVEVAPGEFQPLTHVQGDYSCLCGLQKYLGNQVAGWMDLATGTFHAKGTAEPQAPYITGKQSDKGVFTPDDRAVSF